MSDGREAIEQEIRTKVPAAMPGGYIYCVDHSVAPTVSLADYEYAIELLSEVGRYRT